MKRVALLLTMGSALGIAGCGGDEADNTEAFCTAFGAGATYTWTACNAGCTLANPGQAYDQNLFNSAIIVPVNGQTTYTTKLTATATADAQNRLRFFINLL